ncbi:hypothetical protein KAX17_15410 [Candidatus Bipolaricaulota bacterium]|nr:hypothetical protein [Candidatus Bipolaricaulota bacterium]
MPAVTLSNVPSSPHELEDYVAALFQSAGYFVEKNILERDTHTDILELDVVATSYDEDIPSLVLAEAKSGTWHFADIFKVIGWMKYLGIPKGAFFVSKEIGDKDPDFVREKIAPLDVSFVHLKNFSDSAKYFREAGFPEVQDPVLLKVWRYAYWVERELIDRLRAYKKTNPSRSGVSASMMYHNLINNGIFFVNDIRDRSNQLYKAYGAHPRLSCGEETSGSETSQKPRGQETSGSDLRS